MLLDRYQLAHGGLKHPNIASAVSSMPPPGNPQHAARDLPVQEPAQSTSKQGDLEVWRKAKYENA
jgi:hypothetical protein